MTISVTAITQPTAESGSSDSMAETREIVGHIATVNGHAVPATALLALLQACYTPYKDGIKAPSHGAVEQACFEVIASGLDVCFDCCQLRSVCGCATDEVQS